MLNMYRELRHDYMVSARICKKKGYLESMDEYVVHAYQLHKLIMRFWEDEKDEHNQIVRCAKEHGIILE